MSLPDTWVETTVGQVITDLQSGFAQRPGEEDEGTIPQVRTHNITPEGRISLAGIKHVSPSAQELAKYQLAVGDVVFNNTNSEEWVGKTAVFDQEGEYVFSHHMTRLRGDAARVLPEYLATYLHLLWAQGYSKTRAKRWVSQAAVDGKALARFKFPLPTVLEQHRIVDLFREIEKLSQLRGDVHHLVDQLGKQRFAEMFGHPAENSKGFEVLPLEQFGTLDRGVSKHRPRDASHLIGGPYPFIQTGEVANSGDWITTYNSTYSEAGLAQSKLWPKGTLCITIAANIAKAAILDFDACFPDSVVGFTPVADVSSEYALYCLRFYQEFFEHRAPKSAQMNINLDTLRTLRIPKPPQALQQEFAGFVREVRSLNETISAQASKHADLVRELRMAAFTGELTRDWRDAHRIELGAASTLADATLRSTPSRVLITERAPLEESTSFSRPARIWLTNELSAFQTEVWNMMRHEWRGSVIVDDPDTFNDFCTNPQTAWRIEHFNASPNRVRRVLEQLAALGLVAKVSLPKPNSLTQQTEYLTAFRPIREDENSRLADADSLRKALATDKLGQRLSFDVRLDYGASDRAGAGGTFQVVSIAGDAGEDRTELVDHDSHYPSLHALAADIAKALGVTSERVELREVSE
jgi:type I restriction enzyme, S subunit